MGSGDEPNGASSSCPVSLPPCDGRRHPVLCEVGPGGLPATDEGGTWLDSWYVCPPSLGGCGSFFQIQLVSRHLPRDVARMAHWLGLAVRGTEGEPFLQELRVRYGI